MDNTKITKERVRNHFTYSGWKYVLFAIAAVFGWNLIYTSTAYKAPDDKRLDIYFVTYSIPSETTDWIVQQSLAAFPSLEDATCVSVVYTDQDNYYGSIQLTTFIGAGEGDVYVMTKERFDAFKESGVFAPLDEAIQSGAIDATGIDLSVGTATDENGVHGVFGIPAVSLYGLMDKQIDNRDLMLCVMNYSENQQTAAEFIGWLVETMRAPKPDWVQEAEQKQSTSGAGEAVSDIPSF